MEHVRVRYPRIVNVLVGGKVLGPTKQKLQVERGTHTFSLSEPTKPSAIKIFVKDTSWFDPHELIFLPAMGAHPQSTGAPE